MPSPSLEFYFEIHGTTYQPPFQGQAPIIHLSQGKSPHFPMMTHFSQDNHSSSTEGSPISPNMVTRELGKPNKIQMELAKSNHCVLRKCPKIDPIMLILDKLNMSLSRHIFADMRIDGSTGSTLPDQTNKIEEQKI